MQPGRHGALQGYLKYDFQFDLNVVEDHWDAVFLYENLDGSRLLAVSLSISTSRGTEAFNKIDPL
jgi:hypothetical protein